MKKKRKRGSDKLWSYPTALRQLRRPFAGPPTAIRQLSAGYPTAHFVTLLFYIRVYIRCHMVLEGCKHHCFLDMELLVSHLLRLENRGTIKMAELPVSFAKTIGKLPKLSETFGNSRKTFKNIKIFQKIAQTKLKNSRKFWKKIKIICLLITTKG